MRNLVTAARQLCLAGVCLAANLGLAQSYSVTDLGALYDLGGRSDAKPNGLNAKGQVAEANVASGAYAAWLFTGVWTNLGTLGGSESLAYGLEDSGRVVGRSLTAGGVNHAFLWTPGGTGGVSSNPRMKDLGTLGGAESQAYSINSLGQVSGYSDVPDHPNPVQHAFLYSGGTMSDIGSLLGNLPNSFGYSINKSGHVAGTAYNSSYSVPHAFFYNGSAAADIGGLGGSGAEALAINDTDHIAGYATDTNAYSRAYYYAAGQMQDLGTLGGHYSYGLGINNSNQVVGGTFVDSKDTVYHAFLWANNKMTDLNTLLDQSGAGWTLVEARAINDAGQIVGVGTYGGVNHTFLLSPPVASAPQITRILLQAPDVRVRFTTRNGSVYALETRTNLLNGTWQTVVTNLVGNGAELTATNSGGAAPAQRFYRVRRLSP